MKEAQIKKIKDLTSTNITMIVQIKKNVEEIRKIMEASKVTGKLTDKQLSDIMPLIQQSNEHLKSLFKLCVEG